eukprot:15365327-Ditylum_brightwellii.AAC.1
MTLPPPPSLQPPSVEANKGKKVNPEGEVMANSMQEKQDLHMPKMIDLSTSGLRSSTQNWRAPEQYGYFAMLLGVSTILWTSLSMVPLTVQNQAIFHVEMTTASFDDTINSFSPMTFAANQQQNKTYTYKDMLK